MQWFAKFSGNSATEASNGSALTTKIMRYAWPENVIKVACERPLRNASCRNGKVKKGPQVHIKPSIGKERGELKVSVSI